MRLKETMIDRGYNVSQLARAAGVDTNTVRSIRDGRTKHPHEDTVLKLASALGVSPGYLMGDDETASEYVPVFVPRAQVPEVLGFIQRKT